MIIEKFENNNKKESFEILPVPEIVIQEERGAQLFSLLLKAENEKWGETETELAKEATDYFRKNSLSLNILEMIRGFHDQGVDEETLYNLALTYQHPEKSEKVLELIEKYKPHVNNSQDVREKVLRILQEFDQIFSKSLLAEKFSLEIERDKKERIERKEETKSRIENLINFFRPDNKTTNIQKVVFAPTDPLYKKNSGRAFSAFPGEHIIMSHIDNIDNQDHEFCHAIINPIVEKLLVKLTIEQKNKISELASGGLKKDYGEEFFSLLCEEFIRTYLDVFRKGEKPEAYEDFIQKISNISEEQFREHLNENQNLKDKCEEFEIKNFDDFREKSIEYYEKFGKNQLRELVFRFYQEYESRSNEEIENFEQFVLKNFSGKI